VRIDREQRIILVTGYYAICHGAISDGFEFRDRRTDGRVLSYKEFIFFSLEQRRNVVRTHYVNAERYIGVMRSRAFVLRANKELKQLVF
jgi:hypothetical protein